MADAQAPRKADRRFGWLLSGPAIAAGLVVSIYPLVYLVLSSVSRSTLGMPFQEWVGAQNFSDALQDATFTGSIWRSLAVAVIGSAFQVGIGLVIALLLRQIVRGNAVVRTLILLPMLTPPVMAAVMWKLLLDPNGGLLNALLSKLGVIDQPLSLLGSPVWSTVMIVLADTWQWTPLAALLIFAGLLALPEEVYEAAQMEGCNARQTFWHVTFPLIQPVMLSVFMIKLIMSFKIFDLVYILTAGGPGNSSMLSGYLIFRTALREFDVGYASAQTLLFVLVVTIVTLPIAVLSKRVKW